MAFFRTNTKKEYLSQRIMKELLSQEFAEYLKKVDFENIGKFNIIKSRFLNKIENNTIKQRTKAKALTALDDFEKLLATLRD